MVGRRKDIKSCGRARDVAFVGREGGAAVWSQGVTASGARWLDAAVERRDEVGRQKQAAMGRCRMDAAVCKLRRRARLVGKAAASGCH
eukprot:365704-Chlamydomonas_euryale.AAC.4